MQITYSQLRNEIQLEKYASQHMGIYVIDKFSLLYANILTWCHRYGYNAKKSWHIVKETNTYIWIKAPIPFTSEDFSHYLLNDTVSNNYHDYATIPFVAYCNLHKSLLTIHLFDNVHTLGTNMTTPFQANPKFYSKLRTQALMHNIKKGWLHVDFNHLPSNIAPFYNQTNYSKGLVLYYLSKNYPCMFLFRNSILWAWIKEWFKIHGKDYHDYIQGLQISKHYVYFGVSKVKSAKKYSEIIRHPESYSDIDYYVFRGNSNGAKARKFISWVRANVHSNLTTNTSALANLRMTPKTKAKLKQFKEHELKRIK